MIKNEKFKEMVDELNVRMQTLIYNNCDDRQIAKHRISHSFRTMDIAKELAGYYKARYNITDDKIELLSIAAMMHDCAKFVCDDIHDKIGAEIVKSILEQKDYEGLLTENEIDQVWYCIVSHSDKKQSLTLNDFSILKAILMDADIIEKLGIYDIIGDSIEETFDTMKKYYDKKRKHMKTPLGGEILDKLMQNINNLIDGEPPENKDVLKSINMLTVDFDNLSNRIIDEK